jgi:hypothetical protein
MDEVANESRDGGEVDGQPLELGFCDLHCLYRSEEKREKAFSGTDTSSITFLRGDVSQREVLRQGIDGAATVMEGTARFISLFRPGYRPSMTRLGIRLLTTSLYVSGAKAEQELGFRPKIGFTEGIESVREYVRQL